MFKKISLLIFFLFFLSSPIYSFDRPNFVTVNVSIVGPEEWGNKTQTPLDVPILIHNLATSSSVPINWLLRYDALTDKEVSQTIKSFSASTPRQQIGAHLEITPSLLKSSNLNHSYQDPFSDYRLRLFSSYSASDREKIVDAYMKAFLDIFNTFPQTIYIPKLDPVTLNYLSSKYLVSSVVIDGKSSFSLPFTPNKDNPVMPSSSLSKSLPVVVTEWEGQSLESNDLNQFTHQSIGFDNTTRLSKYEKLINETLANLKTYKEKKSHALINQHEFSRWFVNRYSNASPVYFYTDSSKNAKTYHYQSYRYRLDLVVSGQVARFTNFKVFLPDFVSEYKHFSSYTLPLSQDLPTIADFELKADLSKAEVTFSNNTVSLVSPNGSVSFAPEKIVLQNLGPLNTPSQYLRLSNTSSSQEYTFDTSLPFSKHQPGYYLVLVLILSLFLLLPPSKMGFIFALLAIFTVVFSGLVGDRGLGFYGPNGHDALFHLSLIEQFKKNFFSLVHPQYAGISLQNYHLAVDYAMAILSKVTHTSSLDWYFRLWPLIILFTLVHGLDRLVVSLKFDRTAKLIAFFLAFLGSSLGFIPNLILHGQILGGESIFWSNQPISYFLNPPLITSITIMVWFLAIFSQYLQKKSKKVFLVLVFLGSILAPTKIYSFLLLVSSLILLKKFKLALSIFGLGLIFLSPTLSLGGQLFQVNPLWFSRSMFESIDHLYVERISSAWQAYENSSNLIKLTILNLLGLIIFVIGNLGIRFVGLLLIPKDKTYKLIYYLSLIGLVIPLVFTQANNPWNSIQFFYYSQFFLALLAAPIIRSINLYLLSIIIFVNLLGPIGTLKDYLTPVPSSRVSLVELDAISRFSSYPQGIVVSPLYNHLESKKVPEPKNLYAYISTAYISALSGHQELISDTVNLDITLIDYQPLANQVAKLYQTKDESFIIDFLKTHKVGYLYETPIGKLNVDPNKVCLSKIIETSEINIYKFQCL